MPHFGSRGIHLAVFGFTVKHWLAALCFGDACLLLHSFQDDMAHASSQIIT